MENFKNFVNKLKIWSIKYPFLQSGLILIAFALFAALVAAPGEFTVLFAIGGILFITAEVYWLAKK